MKLSQDAIKKLRATAWQNYKGNKKKGHDLRDKFIEQQALKEEEKGNHDNADQIRSIRSNKYEQDAHREVRNAHPIWSVRNITHRNPIEEKSSCNEKDNQSRPNGKSNEKEL